MGRKIPGKKHRNIKDPYKQKQKRLDSLRLKVDNPPTDADVQEIPKSLLRIIELKNKAREKVVKKSKRKGKGPRLLSVAKLLDKDPFQKGMTRPDQYIPNLVQKPNESAEDFLKRVNSMAQQMIDEVEFERKFGVEIKKNPETGEVLEVKSIKKKNKTSKKKKLSEKRKAKLNEKKQNLSNVKEFSQLKDTIEFGEVVHRPPDLSKLKKKENETQKNKFNSLLLNKVVKETQSKNRNPQNELEKEKIENKRKFIVEHYRKLKKKNQFDSLIL